MQLKSDLLSRVHRILHTCDLVNGDHDIDCKIDGIVAMGLKSEFVKKS